MVVPFDISSDGSELQGNLLAMVAACHDATITELVGDGIGVLSGVSIDDSSTLRVRTFDESSHVVHYIILRRRIFFDTNLVTQIWPIGCTAIEIVSVWINSKNLNTIIPDFL